MSSLVLNGLPRYYLIHRERYRKLTMFVYDTRILDAVSLTFSSGGPLHAILIRDEDVIVVRNACSIENIDKCVTDFDRIDAYIDVAELVDALAEAQQVGEWLSGTAVEVVSSDHLLDVYVEVVKGGRDRVYIRLSGSYANLLEAPRDFTVRRRRAWNPETQTNRVRIAGGIPLGEGIVIPVEVVVYWPTEKIDLRVRKMKDVNVFRVPRSIADKLAGGLSLEIDLELSLLRERLERNRVIDLINTILGNIARLVRIGHDALLYENM